MSWQSCSQQNSYISETATEHKDVNISEGEFKKHPLSWHQVTVGDEQSYAESYFLQLHEAVCNKTFETTYEMKVANQILSD